MFTTILVPLDGSSLAERAVPYAEKLARATGATLVLVRAETSGITGSRVIVIRQALAYLEKLAADLRSRGLTVRTSAPYGQPVAGVIVEAERTEADLIVLYGFDAVECPPGRWRYTAPVIELMKSRARTFIYSTALPPAGSSPPPSELLGGTGGAG